MCTNMQETADLITFTEEVLNGKLHFLYSPLISAANQLPGFYTMKTLVLYGLLYQRIPSSDKYYNRTYFRTILHCEKLNKTP